MKRTTPNALRTLRSPAPPSLRRYYPGIKQDDPSLHPTGSNSGAAKTHGPLGNSQPATGSNARDQSKKSSGGETESNAVVKEQQQKSGQANGQQQRSISTSTTTKRSTVAEEDEELRRRMSGYAGDGGEAGVEYENGEPVAMKRGVRNNMFRYI